MVVTGDLTQLGLRRELHDARRWLERLGSPGSVSVVPGNHDAQSWNSARATQHPWDDYVPSPEREGVRFEARFPTLSSRDGVALIGVSTATPTPLFDASGRIGRGQLERLEAMLVRHRAEGRVRVLAMHHAPEPDVTHRRRSLRDASSLRAVLRRAGAELVIHGHLHRTHRGALAGPDGPIPVVGVASASRVDGQGQRRAGFHLYTAKRRPDGTWKIHWRVHAWDPATRSFAASAEESL